MDRIPVNDTIIYSLARLIDDAQKERRDPSHSDIEFQLTRASLIHVDPNKDGSPVGKAKRLRIVLNWAIEMLFAYKKHLLLEKESAPKMLKYLQRYFSNRRPFGQILLLF